MGETVFKIESSQEKKYVIVWRCETFFEKKLIFVDIFRKKFCFHKYNSLFVLTKDGGSIAFVFLIT